ncbi:MAG: hypothetical protein M3410_03195 [Acidobacteriota bacterium]|nr:hypothetical protein [Acidobacteriota bacterium]
MAEDKEFAEGGGSEEQAVGMTESEIDLNLIDTFPASDPPSWTLGTDHRDDSKGDQGGDKTGAQNEPPNSQRAGGDEHD